MKIDRLQHVISNLIGDDKAPIVIFSAIWPFIKVFDIDYKILPQTFLQSILELVPQDRDLLMPTFARGYIDGVCNLDEEPSSTGIISELFRLNNDSRRSLSAFFSFNIIGPAQEEFINLKPKNAWGDNSAYDWMEKNNAHFLMLGVHPTHCSYLHRMEWLAKEKITYRYVKEFSGQLISQGKSISMKENLFVRSRELNYDNDFTKITSNLERGGLSCHKLDGVNISHIRAQDIRSVYLPLLLENPLITIAQK